MAVGGLPDLGRKVTVHSISLAAVFDEPFAKLPVLYQLGHHDNMCQSVKSQEKEVIS
jgi:hypothetical protein